MAGNAPVRRHLHPTRIDLAADLHDVRAARMKVATGRRRQRGRHLAFELGHDDLGRGIGYGRRVPKRTGEGVQRLVEDRRHVYRVVCGTGTRVPAKTGMPPRISKSRCSTKLVKLCNWNRAIDCHRFAKRLDALDLVHCLGREIRLATMWTRPHGNVFDDQERLTPPKTARDFAQLQAFATARSAQGARQGRP